MDEYIKSSYVAFIDILGFKELVENNSHFRLTSLYLILFNSIRQWSVDHFNKPEIQENIKDYEGENKINSIIISDSIILWTEDLSILSFTIIMTALEELLRLGFTIGLPMRAGVSHGEITAINITGNFTILGKPLNKAYSIEGAQRWSGCVVDSDTVNLIKSKLEKSKDGSSFLFREMNKILRYDVPIKGGSTFKHYVIDWTRLDDEVIEKETIIKAFHEYNKTIKNDSIKHIMDNTIKFYDEVIKFTDQKKK